MSIATEKGDGGQTSLAGGIRVSKADLAGSFALIETDSGGLRATAKVENILDRTYYELGWLAPGTTFVTGLSYRF